MTNQKGLLAGILIFLLSIAAISCNAADDMGGYKNVNQEEFTQLSKQKDVVILDVRTSAESQRGHIAGTHKFIDVYSSDFESQVNKLDKSKTYLVYCASGARSVGASKVMAKNGFTKIYNLVGGFGRWSGAKSK